jgi:flagellar biosynthesis protein FliR
MDISIDTVRVLTVFLVSLRIGAFLMMNPLFSGASAMVSAKVLFAVALSVMLVGAHITQPAMISLTVHEVVAAGAGEVLTGALLGFGMFAAFGVFSMAGKLIDVQSGLGLGAIFDPVTRSGAPLFSTLLNLLAVAVFFGMDGHLAMMRGLSFSLQHIPPGKLFSTMAQLPVVAMTHQFGLMFSLGAALAAPVLFCLFLTEGALAVVSRVLPQMNVLIVGAPAKIAVALGVLAMTLPMMGATMGRVYAGIFRYWEQVVT